MADIASTIEIIFSGVDKVSSTTEAIGNDIKNLGSSIEDIAMPFAEAAEAIAKFEAALAAMAAGSLVYAFNASKNFEASVIELQKVLDDNTSSEAAEQAAINLSDKYGESATSILESMAKFKQAGFDLEGSMELAADALDLVIAGNVDAAFASDKITAAIKGFGLEADDARRYIDILNETSNNYATNVEQLAVAMARVSPVASQMGFTMEETAALVTPIIEVFGSGFEAATGLRTGLVRLTDDTKLVTSTLTELGITQKDTNGKFKSGKDIFYEVAYAMKDMDENQRAFYTQQLVGIEQGPKMLLLFSDLEKVLGITETAMGAAGSATAEVQKRLESSEVAVNRMVTGFNNLAIAVGDSFREAAEESINGVTDIENAFRNLVETGTFDPVLKLVEGFAGDLGTALKSIAEDLPEAFANVDFTELTDGLGNLKEAFESIFDGVDLSTPEGLSEVIQTVIDALGGIQNVVAGMVNFTKPITDAIGTLITKFSELSPEAQTLIGNLTAAGAALSTLGVVLAAGGAVLAGIGALGVALTGPVGVVAGITAMSAATVIATGSIANWVAKKWNEDLDKETAALEKHNTELESLLDQLNELPEDAPTLDIEMAILSEDFEKAQQLIDEAIAEPKVLSIETQIEQEELQEAQDFYDKLVSLPDEVSTKFFAEVDPTDEAAVTKFFADLEQDSKKVVIAPEVDAKAAADAQEQLDELAKISLKGDIEKELASIKASAETAQSAFEWTAKVDIAQAESAAKQVEAAFSSVDNAISSTAEVITSSLGILSDSGNFEAKWEAREVLDQEQEYREQSLALQKELTEAQIEYMDARTKALNSGDMAINISSDGLEPALEMVMWEIIKKVQLRANEESADFLLGIG